MNAFLVSERFDIIKKSLPAILSETAYNEAHSLVEGM